MMMATSSDGIKITAYYDDVPHKAHNGTERQRTSLVSSNDGRNYGTVHTGSPRNSGFLIHQIQKSDTIQGIALRYEVPVAEIQRTNRLFPSESIHVRSELKIPFTVPSAKSSPRSSPKDFLRTSMCSTDEEDEPEVKRKPVVAGERDIATMLSAIDQQLKISREFADKLGRKTASMRPAPDAYNRETPPIVEVQKGAKPKRTFKLPKQSMDKDSVEDEIFEL